MKIKEKLWVPVCLIVLLQMIAASNSFAATKNKKQNSSSKSSQSIQVANSLIEPLFDLESVERFVNKNKPIYKNDDYSLYWDGKKNTFQECENTSELDKKGNLHIKLKKPKKGTFGVQLVYMYADPSQHNYIRYKVIMVGLDPKASKYSPISESYFLTDGGSDWRILNTGWTDAADGSEMEYAVKYIK
jgi:hypothetical protein